MLGVTTHQPGCVRASPAAAAPAQPMRPVHWRRANSVYFASHCYVHSAGPSSVGLNNSVQTSISCSRRHAQRQGTSRFVGVAAASAAATVTTNQALELETDPKGRQRLKLQREGWNFWEWQGHKIHFVEAGPKDAPKVVLVHGYGASAYHWRYNVPALSQHYHVFAIDMLGFGWSTKALVDYSGARVWTQQISDFVREVVGGGPVVLAGNSLGGYAAMATAARHPELVSGLALLNAAGPFDDPSKPAKEETAPWWQPLQEAVVAAVKRVVLYFAFLRARQPERIKEVLTFVYSSRDSIDEELVDSIVQPAQDPQASEVFYLINQTKGPRVTVNKLLSEIKVPVLLLWGDLDPWITPARAQQIKKLYPSATLVGIQAGHCPHDDTPEEANQQLLSWLDGLQLPGSSPGGSVAQPPAV